MERRTTKRVDPNGSRRRLHEPPVDESTLATWRQLYSQRPTTEACPDDEALAAFVLDRRGTGEVGDDPLLEHVVRCPRCAQAVRDLWELDREARRFSRRRVARAWPVAAALALLFAAALAWMLLAPPPAGDGGDQALRGSSAEVVPADGASLTAPPAELSWPPQAGATAYRVELHDAAGESVYDSPTLGRSSLGLPSEVTARLAPGTYYWVVEVEGPVAAPRLGPFWWTLTPPGP